MVAAIIAPASARLSNPLTDFASNYANKTFIADTVCPIMLTDKMTGSFGKRLRIDVTTPVDDLASSRAQLNETTYSVDSDTYSCVARGLKQPVSTELQVNADAWVDPKQFAVGNVMQRLMLAREIRVSTLFGTQANWASTNTGAVSNLWSDKTNGTPLDDLLTARRAIPQHGEEVQVIGICSDTVWDALSVHPQILEILGGGSQSGTVTTDALAKRIRCSSILVSDLDKNTAKYGVAASYSRVWNAQQFYFAVVPAQLQSTEQHVFGVTFRNKYPGSQNGILAFEWLENNQGLGGTEFTSAGFYDHEKIVQNDAGYQLRSVL
jgi:hypothetical protein